MTNSMQKMHPALVELIDALAKRAAQDYLTQKSASDMEKPGQRSNHVDLPEIGKAA